MVSTRPSAAITTPEPARAVPSTSAVCASSGMTARTPTTASSGPAAAGPDAQAKAEANAPANMTPRSRKEIVSNAGSGAMGLGVMPASRSAPY